MKLGFLFTLSGYTFVEKRCTQTLNECWLRNFEFQWEDLIDERRFCEQLFEFDIFRFSYTLEEIDAKLCPLLESVTTKKNFVYYVFGDVKSEN